MSNVKSQINNNCSNGIANLCCQQPNSVTVSENMVKPLTEQNIPKKTIKIVDAQNITKNLDENKKENKKSTTPADQSSPSSPSSQKQKYKIIEDENNMQGIKLTDIALPHISVKTVECKKTDKPTTTIVIYKPKNGGAPTAKVIMTKVRAAHIFLFCVSLLFTKYLYFLINKCVFHRYFLLLVKKLNVHFLFLNIIIILL